MVIIPEPRCFSCICTSCSKQITCPKMPCRFKEVTDVLECTDVVPYNSCIDHDDYDPQVEEAMSVYEN